MNGALWDPVGSSPSLLSVVRAGAVGAAPLPDDPPPAANGLRWAPGALGGVLSQHAAPMSVPDAITDQVVTVLERHRDGRLDRDELERLVATLATGPVAAGDRVARAVIGWVRTEPDPGRTPATAAAMADLARWLIDTGTDRHAAGVGMALAGLLTGLAGRQAEIEVLGRHEALAQDAVRALRGLGPDAVRALRGLGPDAVEPLWELARQHTGWGRIHAVEALAPFAGQPDLRRWLVTRGFRNHVHLGYTVPLVVRAADVAGLLREVDPDTAERPLLDGARDIALSVLEPGGPAGSVDDLPETAEILLWWLDSVTAAGPERMSLDDVDAAAGLVPELDELDPDLGFDDERREAVGRACRRILTDPAVRGLVRAAIEDGTALNGSLQAAELLGIDPLPALLQALGAAPEQGWLWYQASRAVPDGAADRAGELLAAARALLPADAVSTDRRAVVGPVPGLHQGVIFLLQHLVSRFPGIGWPWLEPLLRSPLVGARAQALTAVTTWPRAGWPVEAVGALAAARDRETDDRLRARFEAVLG
ncbi:hypothetical protein [Nakamurella leprariae]|uniref:Uncharacterized protein n=1 Tax=Nakamurella leprariae TaxID=2803911 RepID=A0A938YA12_9ACTN|nr:hypothetical protein [Nakamurella leprariae]MBM9468645.1 hypothetical protein [Nakamurella leprariae]